MLYKFRRNVDPIYRSCRYIYLHAFNIEIPPYHRNNTGLFSIKIGEFAICVPKKFKYHGPANRQYYSGLL